MSEFNTDNVSWYAAAFAQNPDAYAEGPLHVDSQVEVLGGVHAGEHGVVTKVFVGEKYGLVFRVDAGGDYRFFTQDCLTQYDPSTGQPDV